MSEIEKLYENTGIPKYGKRQCKDSEYLECQNYCFCSIDNKCDKFIIDYPPFTAEKQLKLIKWLAINKEDFGIHYRDYDEEYCWVCGCEFEVEVYRIFNEDETFEESLAGLMNRLWECLSEEEKQQIKEILE